MSKRDWLTSVAGGTVATVTTAATTFDGVPSEVFRIRSVATTGDAIVVLGHEETRSQKGVPVTWRTEDGITWTRTVLPGADEVSTFLLIHGDAGYVALAEGLAEVIAWSSADGIDWQLSESELPYRARSAMMVGDGLAVYSDTGVTVRGLDWGL